MTLSQTIRGWVFYVFLALSIILLGIALLTTRFFAPLDWRYEAICRRWARSVCVLLRVICGIHIKVEGFENFPAKNIPAVVLCKHQSAWDPFWLGAYLPAPACFLYKRSLHWIPMLGWALWSMDMLAIDRSKGRSAFESFMRKGPEFLKRGWWICLFPEGTRVPPGKHVSYKTGGARFACSQGVPVVPIAHNAGLCWPKNSIAKRAGTITVSIGPVIETAGRDAHEVTRDVETWIENEVARISVDVAKQVK